MRTDNGSMFTGLYSEYYDEEISIVEANEAIEAYLEWCEKEKLESEIGAWQTALELSDNQLEHVLYHYREVIK